jgi:hypothetical protein
VSTAPRAICSACSKESDISTVERSRQQDVLRQNRGKTVAAAPGGSEKHHFHARRVPRRLVLDD